MISKSKKNAKSASAPSADSRVQDPDDSFPLMSQFSQITNTNSQIDCSSPQRTVSNSIMGVGNDDDNDMMIGTTTTTPRSEFQTFANSILTPLLLSADELNIATMPPMEHTMVNPTTSVEVSPLMPSYQLMDNANSRPIHSHLSQLNNNMPTSKDWHSISHSRQVVSGATFASMFASPSRADESHFNNEAASRKYRNTQSSSNYEHNNYNPSYPCCNSFKDVNSCGGTCYNLVTRN